MEHEAVVVFHCYWCVFWCLVEDIALFLASHPNAMFGGMHSFHSHIQTKNLASRIYLNLADCLYRCLLHRVLYFEVMHLCTCVFECCQVNIESIYIHFNPWSPGTLFLSVPVLLHFVPSCFSLSVV